MRKVSYKINLVLELVPLGSAISESGIQCIPQTVFHRNNLVGSIASSSPNQLCVGSVASPPCSLAWLLAAAAPRREVACSNGETTRKPTQLLVPFGEHFGIDGYFGNYENEYEDGNMAQAEYDQG